MGSLGIRLQPDFQHPERNGSIQQRQKQLMGNVRRERKHSLASSGRMRKSYTRIKINDETDYAQILVTIGFVITVVNFAMRPRKVDKHEGQEMSRIKTARSGPMGRASMSSETTLA